MFVIQVTLNQLTKINQRLINICLKQVRKKCDICDNRFFFVLILQRNFFDDLLEAEFCRSIICGIQQVVSNFVFINKG